MTWHPEWICLKVICTQWFPAHHKLLFYIKKKERLLRHALKLLPLCHFKIVLDVHHSRCCLSLRIHLEAKKQKKTKSKQEVSIHKSIYLWSLGTHTKVPAAAATTTKVALHGAKVRGLGVVVAHVVVVIAATAASTTTTIACDYRVCRIGQPQASYNSSKRQCNGIILP